ncbi:excinuclease ABC subunit UvrB, partial [Candidatus Gracilibacteria bacterium]|nr:excinuclease ABC subunit UvrB [Candidatus Gracilibacteria bacterium]
MQKKKFKLKSKFKPSGDQPKAIKTLVEGIKNGEKEQVLLGATGTGKTFTIANVIQATQKTTIIFAHNKTLAAQLAAEMKEFFPDNAVCYYISYYDYYQPEAYIPKSDTFIEKTTQINEEIAKYRHFATQNLIERNDVIIIASVSAIYGLGDPEDYKKLAINLKVGDEINRNDFLRKLTDIQFTRNFGSFKQGQFNVLGDIVEVFPPAGDDIIRIEFFGDEIEKISRVDHLIGDTIEEVDFFRIYPAKHNVTLKEKIKEAIPNIIEEMKTQEKFFLDRGDALAAERIVVRTSYDIEMLRETGYCNGVENYVKHLNFHEGQKKVPTLLDFLPEDFLLIIDESHITVPQIGAMYEGNKSRKQSLINYGFRLPSSEENRPLMFSEFEEYMKNTIFVSATPGKYEYRNGDENTRVAQQIIRPTGLLDPKITVKKKDKMVEDVCDEIRKVIAKGERALVTTVTKKSAEEISNHFLSQGIKANYLHSEIDTMERIEILRDLRLGKIDVIVGINLLREGLDLPEVSLISILDADKRGFLRSKDALIQIIGRAARNVNGRVIMYGDEITEVMEYAINETNRRRSIQEEYNKKHGIT